MEPNMNFESSKCSGCVKWHDDDSEAALFIAFIKIPWCENEWNEGSGGNQYIWLMRLTPTLQCHSLITAAETHCAHFINITRFDSSSSNPFLENIPFIHCTWFVRWEFNNTQKGICVIQTIAMFNFGPLITIAPAATYCPHFLSIITRFESSSNTF